MKVIEASELINEAIGIQAELPQNNEAKPSPMAYAFLTIRLISIGTGNKEEHGTKKNALSKRCISPQTFDITI